MTPLSCLNCWHNALQYGSVGLSIGFCTEHSLLLNRSTETTCGRHMRKDLSLANVRRQHQHHREDFSDDIVVIKTRRPSVAAISEREKDIDLLRQDEVADVVAEYGQLGARIESIAQLRRIPGARAELAMLSLARAYVHRCVERLGSWTNGIHVFWWTRKRLDTLPELGVRDIQPTNTLPLDRKVELARWSLIMLRLSFLADVASYAEGTGHPITRLSTLNDEAAEAVHTFNNRRLLTWTRRVALKEIDRALPRSRYTELARELHHSPNDAKGGVAA